MKGKAYVVVSPEIIIEILKGLQGPMNSPRRFEVEANALPADAELMSVDFTPMSGNIRIWIRSDSIDSQGSQLESPILRLVSE